MPQELIRLEPSMISTDWQLLRKVRPEEMDFKEMKESIRLEGIKIPLLVRKIPVEGGEIFSLIDGGNRLVAAKELGLPNVPCFIEEDCNDIRALTLQASLNIQRIETKKGELARQIHRIVHMDGALSQAKIAKMFGKSLKWLRDTLSINNLPDYVIALIDEDKLTMANAIHLIKAPEIDVGSLIDDAQVLTSEAFEVLVSECIKNRRAHSGKTIGDDWIPTPERRKVSELLSKVQREIFTELELKHISTLAERTDAFLEGILYAISMDELTVLERKEKRERILEEQQERELLRQLERKAEETAELQKRLNKFKKENT